jgi:hypothetical protein
MPRSGQSPTDRASASNSLQGDARVRVRAYSVPELLTNASIVPSGDHDGTFIVP